MKIKTLTLALALVAFAATVGYAQPKRTVARLPSAACAAGNIENQIYVVTDGDTVIDCTSGGGTVAALCVCDDGVFAPLAGADATDLTAYVLKTLAGQQSITATGAGNDITLSTLASGDDIIVQAGDDISLESGAAGATAVIGATSAGLFSPDGDTEVSAEDGQIRLYVQDGDIGLIIDDNGIIVKEMLRIHRDTTPPATCDGTTEGGLYLDSDTHLLCVCNGTGWVQVADGTTGCS